MEKAFENYKKALEKHIANQKAEAISKDATRKSHHELILARDELRAVEREILEDSIRNL